MAARSSNLRQRLVNQLKDKRRQQEEGMTGSYAFWEVEHRGHAGTSRLPMKRSKNGKKMMKFMILVKVGSDGISERYHLQQPRD